MIYRIFVALFMLAFSSVSLAEEPRYCEIFNGEGKKVGLVDLKWSKVGLIREDKSVVAVGLVRSKRFTDNIFSYVIYNYDRSLVKFDSGYADLEGNVFQVQNFSNYVKVAKVDASQRSILDDQGEKIGSYSESCETAWGASIAAGVGASVDALSWFRNGRPRSFFGYCAQYECEW